MITWVDREADKLLLALANAKPEKAHDVAADFLARAWAEGYNDATSENE